MNPVALELGPINIYWYSIMIFIAIAIGSFIFFYFSKKDNYSKEFLSNLVFYSLIAAIIGARLYYVLFNLDYYLANPFKILAIWNGGLAIHGGILGGVLFAIFYCKKHRKNFLHLFDLAVPGLIIGQAIGRWGNFFNQEAHGDIISKAKLENMPIPEFVVKGMYINGHYYEPTFFYESVCCIIGFIVLFIILKKLKKKLTPGTMSGLYLTWYSSCRFFIERLRTDSLMLSNIKAAQLISIMLFILGIILIAYKSKILNKKNMKTIIYLLRKKGI